jgi:hypothetical protein
MNLFGLPHFKGRRRDGKGFAMQRRMAVPIWNDNHALGKGILAIRSAFPNQRFHEAGLLAKQRDSIIGAQKV